MIDSFLNHELSGSLWRRWDPHVHFPGTLHEDRYGSVEISEALNALASRTPQIEVVGVTDYFLADSYRRVREVWQSGEGASIKCIFPNIELRIDARTNRGGAINLHLLTSDDCLEGLEEFLSTLEFTYNSRKFLGSRTSLMALGREFTNNPKLEDLAALRTGALEFKVSFEALRKEFNNDKWLRKNVLVAVPGGQDGTSGLRDQHGSFDALRRNIERLAQIVFSSQPSQIEFWLGKRAASVDELEHLYGGMKPCLHGSDAHELGRMGMPDGNRFCWVKGDPNFESLKMACLAPDTRVNISEVSPSLGKADGRITALKINDGEWFTNREVPINPGLVAIIGARGSGKTAFADLLAAGAGDTSVLLNKASFIRRAGDLLNGTDVEVCWGEADSTEVIFPIQAPGFDNEQSIRYLSQQFVERLCAADGVSDELLVEIERVIFNAWPIAQRQGATNFRDFLDIRMQLAKSLQRTALESVDELSMEVVKLRGEVREIPQKEKQLLELRRQFETLQKQIENLTKAANPKSTERLTSVSSALTQRRTELQVIDRKITQLLALAAQVDVDVNQRFSQYPNKLKSEYPSTELTEQEWESFEIVFKGDVPLLVKEKVAKSNFEKLRIGGSATEKASSAAPLNDLPEAELLTLTVLVLEAEENRLRGLVGLDARRSKDLTETSNKAAIVTAQITKLEADVANKPILSSRINNAVESRLAAYRRYFDALRQEEDELRALYEPLQVVLENIGSSSSRLEFTVNRIADVKAWADEGEALLDLRKESLFRGHGALERIARDNLLSGWENGDGEEVAEAIRLFSQDYSKSISDVRTKEISDSPLKQIAWETAINRWLYNAGHITIRYSLKYGGLNIERLSPGTRGIVLLLLYLAIDQEEIKPLIIDQPEENLDPESIYSELVSLFRSACQRRQIIMVTHNANLVVNTDVDQVIVAKCGALAEGKLPEFSYISGGLDNEHIRRSVCEVLEGGAEAFRQRAKRLRIEFPVPSDFDEAIGSSEYENPTAS